ncbi:hypothetical protein P3440_22845, partial [Vibrio parahaemolyticus]|nr:hypothetical protein [Vibrio parahaemolyticus]
MVRWKTEDQGRGDAALPRQPPVGKQISFHRAAVQQLQICRGGGADTTRGSILNLSAVTVLATFLHTAPLSGHFIR